MAALRRFENRTAGYWQKDESETISDKRLRFLHDQMDEARKDLVEAIARHLPREVKPLDCGCTITPPQRCPMHDQP